MPLLIFHIGGMISQTTLLQIMLAPTEWPDLDLALWPDRDFLCWVWISLNAKPKLFASGFTAFFYRNTILTDRARVTIITQTEAYYKQSRIVRYILQYNYSNNAELSPNVKYLVRVVLNTLSAIPHSCKPNEKDTESIHEIQGVIQG